ncbi:MAG: branched-chain amino acid ABC transporter permease [Actinomycetaceae bacterium]
MEVLAQAVLNGALIGLVYALIAVGLTLVYGVMDVINFAHAEFMMLGMFGGYVFSSAFGIDPLIAAPIVGLIIFVIGAATERIIIEPLLRSHSSTQVMATVGLGLVLASIMALIFGNTSRSATTPYQGQSISILGLHASAPYLYAGIYALVVAGLLWFFLSRTETGRAMRATAQNRNAATLMGINSKSMYMLAFGIGTGLAGLAGAVILPYTLVHPYIGQQYVLIMFTVVVLGTLGSVKGALIAGVVVGVIQSLTSQYLKTEMQNLVVFVVFFVVLVLVPGGGIKAIRHKIERRGRRVSHQPA